jgi:hypothetical protein
MCIRASRARARACKKVAAEMLLREAQLTAIVPLGTRAVGDARASLALGAAMIHPLPRRVFWDVTCFSCGNLWHVAWQRGETPEAVLQIPGDRTMYEAVGSIYIPFDGIVHLQLTRWVGREEALERRCCQLGVTQPAQLLPQDVSWACENKFTARCDDHQHN